MGDTKWKFSRDFTYNASLSGWPDGKLLTLDLKKYETLTFIANVYIVKMYDLKGKQIDIHHNDNLTEIKEDEQIEPEKQSEKQQKSPSSDLISPGANKENNRTSNNSGHSCSRSK